MSLPKFVRNSLSAALNSPILQALGGEVYGVLKDHFVLSTQEMTLAYQNSYAYALSAIAAGLAQEDSWRAFWQKIANSRVQSEFSSQVVNLYLTPFAQAQNLQGTALNEFRQQTMKACQALVAQKEQLFRSPSFQFTETELAMLIKDTEITTLSDLVLEHLQSVPQIRECLTESLVQFFTYKNLLGHALLFFLREQLRNNERFERTLSVLRQEGLLVDVQDLRKAQTELAAILTNKLATIEQQLAAQNQQLTQASNPEALNQAWQQKQTLQARQQSILETMNQMASRLQQAQTAWQSTYGEFIQFSHQFQDWTVFANQKLEVIVAALPDLQYVVEKIDQNVEKLLDGQDVILEEIRKLQQWGNPLQAKPRTTEIETSSKPETVIVQPKSQESSTPTSPVSSTTPSPRYTDNGNGTVTDHKTGLIWLQNVNCFSAQNWVRAQRSVAKLGDGNCGLTDGSKAGDWRLPSREEWEAMLDKRYRNPVLSNAAGNGHWIEGEIFSGVQTHYYWSSTDNTFVLLYDGFIGTEKPTKVFHLWPVRDRRTDEVV